MKIITYLLAVLAVSFPGTVISSTWKEYLGSQDDDVAWADTVRGVTRGQTGLAVMQASHGETYDFQPLLQSLATVTATKDIIVSVGGMGSGRRADVVDNYMRMIRYDKGERWRQLIFEQTSAVAEGSPQRSVYWQVGNEINSWHYLDTLSSWEDSDEVVVRDPMEDIRLMSRGDSQAKAQRKEERKQTRNQLKKLKRNGSDIVPLYVEYFLAPTAQAIIDARKHQSGDENRVKIVLGTLANSHSEHARSWLDGLLNYRIRGDYAPQLAGRNVSEVVDIVALHYMTSSPGPGWRDALRDLYRDWLGKGSIRGIWSTEEIGRKRGLANLGGATAISVLARYMDLWHELGIDPSQGRANFWGWSLGDDGTRAEDAMQTLMKLIGDTPLIPVDEGEVSLQSSGDHESHAFSTAKGQLVLVQFAADKSSRFSFEGFQAKWDCGSEPSVRAIAFGKLGQVPLEHEVSLNDGLLTVSTGKTRSNRDVVMVIVDRD